MSISSHAPPGTEVVNVIATDQDSGRFGQITYEIHPGDLSSLFTLDRHTGGVYLYFKTGKLLVLTVVLTPTSVITTLFTSSFQKRF